MQDVLDTIETAYAGTIVGQTYQRHAHGRCRACCCPMQRGISRPQLSQLMIASPLGPVPLSQVARVEATRTATASSTTAASVASA